MDNLVLLMGILRNTFACQAHALLVQTLELVTITRAELSFMFLRRSANGKMVICDVRGVNSESF